MGKLGFVLFYNLTKQNYTIVRILSNGISYCQEIPLKYIKKNVSAAQCGFIIIYLKKEEENF